MLSGEYIQSFYPADTFRTTNALYHLSSHRLSACTNTCLLLGSEIPHTQTRYLQKVQICFLMRSFDSFQSRQIQPLVVLSAEMCVRKKSCPPDVRGLYQRSKRPITISFGFFALHPYLSLARFSSGITQNHSKINGVIDPTSIRTSTSVIIRKPCSTSAFTIEGGTSTKLQSY